MWICMQQSCFKKLNKCCFHSFVNLQHTNPRYYLVCDVIQRKLSTKHFYYIILKVTILKFIRDMLYSAIPQFGQHAENVISVSARFCPVYVNYSHYWVDFMQMTDELRTGQYVRRTLQSINIQENCFLFPSDKVNFCARC